MPTRTTVQGRAAAPAKAAKSAVGGGARPYALGRNFERTTRSRLERCGFFVLRAYGSKGRVDLLAVAKDRPVLFVQCKRRGEIGSEEWNALFLLAEQHGAWAVLATKLSERTMGFFRLEGEREYRKRARPSTQFDPTTCLPTPTQMPPL